MSDLDEMLKEGPSLTFEPFAGDVQTAETVPAAVLPKEIGRASCRERV